MNPRASLLRQLLGDQIESLHGALKDFTENPGRAQGSLTVTHHTGRMARFFIWLLRLPAAGDNLAATIQVTAKPTSEEWHRVIGPSQFRSQQRVKNGHLEELAGPFRFVQRVAVQDGTLHYRHTEVYLLGLRLPRLMSPIIDAEARGDATGWDVAVTVSCPRCGPICHYEGRMKPE